MDARPQGAAASLINFRRFTTQEKLFPPCVRFSACLDPNLVECRFVSKPEHTALSVPARDPPA
jgi:hypothetical protein